MKRSLYPPIHALTFAGFLTGLAATATGQEAPEWGRKRTAVYANLGAGPLVVPGKGDVASIGLTVLPARAPVGVALHGRLGALRAVDLPADFRPADLLFGNGSSLIPLDVFWTAGITGVWVFCPVPKARALRLRVEAGPSFARSLKNHFAPDPSASGGWFSNWNSNYQVWRHWQSALGAEGSIRLEGVGRPAGGSVGIWAHASNVFQLVGVDFAVVVGRCRKD